VRSTRSPSPASSAQSPAGSLERGVRDMARVLATVSVAKSYQLAPSAPVRIATPAEDLEGRRSKLAQELNFFPRPLFTCFVSPVLASIVNGPYETLRGATGVDNT